ncbi:hypothetical protein CB0940_00582 [Cercospora beticola]|uniref:Lytic polysaccharide monooxygenase n=1 Tax=Cercospora beticola TaxID=122368 RepID=A0A2G5I794_CERBT|nr:hypothetical protein CB0940_00582 [Cercospora beticola]PIB00678.1 hypothetical protein CB0940_00582 [Cercospora beticola]WPA96001.1 hypothetical protein RHO25_000606 [Cercospora beticola]CAK1355726.1 unnamed protein product [Cercospora beticola]
MFANALSSTVAVLALLGQVSAHMKMATPIPYDKKDITSSPLQSRNEYPCQRQTYNFEPSEMNEMKVGDNQTLSFDGSASHGGGTCQLAISLDAKPTKDSVFKLIQVFEGGCPTSGGGNDGSHPFTFKIPQGFPNGDFALAWTWYNKIGNREIYQNCAPIRVTGGADNNDVYDSLPEHYIINLPTSECSSVETSDQIIPFPGQYIITGEGAKPASATGPSCEASAAAMTKNVKGYKSEVSDNGAAYTAPAGGSGPGASAPASSAAQATSAAGYGGAPSSYNNGQYSAPVTTSAATSVATSAAASADTSTMASSEVESAPISYPTLSLSSGAGVNAPAAGTASAYTPIGTGSTSAPSEGSSSGNGIICDASHANQFGVNVGDETVWRAVAAGTTCEQIAAYRKRSLRHAHVRRHLQNVGRI